ncbi:MAG: hypothetical protein HYY24_06335 [Verrucomicrobia bacterium]|nr:hypothetical protein [Verrucomicrobiota bacterium]
MVHSLRSTGIASKGRFLQLLPFAAHPCGEAEERELEVARFNIAGQHKGRVKKVETTAEQKATHGGRFATWHVKPIAPLTPDEYVLAISGGSLNK